MLERLRDWLAGTAGSRVLPNGRACRPDAPPLFVKYARTLWGIPSSYDRVIVVATLALVTMGVVAFLSAAQPELEGSVSHASQRVIEHYAFSIAFAAIVAVAICRASLERILSVTSTTYWATMAIALVVVATSIEASARGYAVLPLGPLGIDVAPLMVLVTILHLAIHVGTCADLKRGLGVRTVVTCAIPICLLLLVPNASLLFVLLLAIVILLAMAGYYWIATHSSIAIVLTSLWTIIFSSPYRMHRMLYFLDPSIDRPGSSSWMGNPLAAAIMRGKYLGVGYGEGLAMHYDPQGIYTDSLTVLIAEEFGFAGILILVALVAIITLFSLRAARLYASTAVQLVIVGIATFLVVTALFNLGSIAGLLSLRRSLYPFFGLNLGWMLSNAIGAAVLIVAIRDYRSQSRGMQAG